MPAETPFEWDPAPVEGHANRAEQLLEQQGTHRALIDRGVLELGAYSYFAPRVHAYPGDSTKVVIGKWCSVAPDCDIYVGGIHRTDWVTSYGMRAVLDLPGAFEDGTPATRGNVVIGHDCWIANGSTIFSGITIGDGAVVGAKAVVTKDVAPYEIVAGNPARVVGRRFPPEIGDALQRIAWWDWEEAQIREHVDLLCSDRLDDFVARFDR